jgi:NitT/TauT family transport system substrate-binding protein
VQGSGNGIVVPKASPVQSLAELKGKTISVPFASTAARHAAARHQGAGMGAGQGHHRRHAIAGGRRLRPANQQDRGACGLRAVRRTVPAWRGFARKIFDGSQAHAPTLHGSLVDADYAKKYPEIVTAFLRAAIEADRIIAAEPEKYSELIAKVTGIEAEVELSVPRPARPADARPHVEAGVPPGGANFDRYAEADQAHRQ